MLGVAIGAIFNIQQSKTRQLISMLTFLNAPFQHSKATQLGIALFLTAEAPYVNRSKIAVLKFQMGVW